MTFEMLINSKFMLLNYSKLNCEDLTLLQPNMHFLLMCLILLYCVVIYYRLSRILQREAIKKEIYS